MAVSFQLEQSPTVHRTICRRVSYNHTISSLHAFMGTQIRFAYDTSCCAESPPAPVAYSMASVLLVFAALVGNNGGFFNTSLGTLLGLYLLSLFPISLHSVSSSSLNSLKLFLLYPNFFIPFFIKSPVLYRGFRAVFIILLASPGFPPLQAPPLASPSLARRVKPKSLARIACAAL
jgi:hypothetical protein